MELYILLFFLKCTDVQAFATENSSFPHTLTVRPGDDTRLLCNITGYEVVSWYLLNDMEDFTLLISAEKTRTRKILPVNYNQDDERFILEPDSEVNTAIFTINNVNKDDLGRYFCGTKARFQDHMHFKKVTTLQFEVEKEEPEDEKEDVEKEGEPTVCEKVLMFGGVGVAALLFLLSTIVAYSVIRC
ncbi:uncharacterized protein Hap1MRO34_001486 [Clarias gariepinus]